MRKYLLIILISFSYNNLTAQEVNLSDSIIYFGTKPVAYFVKELDESTPHYNVYIISMEKQLLLAAHIVKFDAPVKELNPFYYYNLILKGQPTDDTLAIYHEGQAFSLELAQLLKKYKLLDSNRINGNAWTTFKSEYNGTNALQSKIEEYRNYLNETRYFNEQVNRDRTQPVTILNGKTIMQDGKNIGLIVTVTNVQGGGISTVTNAGQSPQVARTAQPGWQEKPITTKEYTQIVLPNNRIVDPSKAVLPSKDNKYKKHDPPSLYEISYPLNKESRNDDILFLVCQYIDNYLL